MRVSNVIWFHGPCGSAHIEVWALVARLGPVCTGYQGVDGTFWCSLSQGRQLGPQTWTVWGLKVVPTFFSVEVVLGSLKCRRKA